MMIKTAVIGASGYIGGHLWRSYRESFPDCIGTSFSRNGAGLTHFDIRQSKLALLRLEETGHRAVLIASARPNIAFCENNNDASLAVNVGGMLQFIEQVGRTSMSLIFLSSDYVFEGTTGCYADNAEAKPTTAYGRQKLIVEQAIPSLTDKYLVLRLSKIYGLRKNDGTLLDELARSLVTGQEILAAADQVFCPTEVSDLVRAIHLIQVSQSNRVTNICSPECWSRYAIACALAQTLEVDVSRIKKISLHDITAMKNRPLNTSMLCSHFRASTASVFRPLRDSIKQAAANWMSELGRKAA